MCNALKGDSLAIKAQSLFPACRFTDNPPHSPSNARSERKRHRLRSQISDMSHQTPEVSERPERPISSVSAEAAGHQREIESTSIILLELLTYLVLDDLRRIV